MKRGSAAAGTFVVLFSGTLASGHRLDEYLQATTISLEKDRINAQLRLTPGVAVSAIVLTSIDKDADGVVSATEQRAYATRVLRDLSLTLDGDQLSLRLVSTKFPAIEEIKEGRGEIQIEFYAETAAYSPRRALVFENRHQSAISAYLVNCLVPRDTDIRVTAEDRNYQQSFYKLDYRQSGDRSSLSGSRIGPVLLGTAALLLLARLLTLRRQRG